MFDTMITMVSRTVGFKPTKLRIFSFGACHGTCAVSENKSAGFRLKELKHLRIKWSKVAPPMPPPAMVVTNRGIGGALLGSYEEFDGH